MLHFKTRNLRNCNMKLSLYFTVTFLHIDYCVKCFTYIDIKNCKSLVCSSATLWFQYKKIRYIKRSIDFFTMNQHSLLKPSSLHKAIEADFADITRKHLEYWNEKTDQSSHENLSFQPIFSEATYLTPKSRLKRSGIQKILQVNTLIFRKIFLMWVS